MDKKCNICSGRILSHSRTMKCELCYNHCHLKCISLNSDERSNIMRDTNCWYCHLCLSSVFHFNHIGDDSEFYKAIWTKDIWNVDLLDLSDKVFNPLENLDRELNDLLDEYDPDLNFYNEIYQKSMHKCDYLTESSFKDKLSLSKCIAAASFSLCHINIRSLNRNLDDFIFLTESVGFDFLFWASLKLGYEMITVICMVYQDIQFVKSTDIMPLEVVLPFMSCMTLLILRDVIYLILMNVWNLSLLIYLGVYFKWIKI